MALAVACLALPVLVAGNSTSLQCSFAPLCDASWLTDVWAYDAGQRHRHRRLQQQITGHNLAGQPLSVLKEASPLGSGLQPSLLTLTDSSAEGLRKRTGGSHLVPSLLSTSKSSLPGSVSATPSPQASSQAASLPSSQPTQIDHQSCGGADRSSKVSATAKLDIEPGELTLCRNEEGQPVLLGTGGFGRVSMLPSQAVQRQAVDNLMISA